MSAEVRNQAIDVSASCLVQAPAGSGKTELLTQRILALLAIVDEPEEILALTFTRKAAAEMGGRVIDALCMQKPDNDSHKMLTWQLASAALQRSQECGWNLAEHPARLRVMTLDSLAGSLARQLPLLSGLGDMPAPSEHSIALYKEAVESVLNQAMSRNFAAVETLLLHQDHNTGSVIELMAKMLENREQWLVHIANHGRNTASLKEALESNLAELISHQIRQCDAAIPIAAKAALPALIQFAGRQLNDMAMTDFKAWPNADIESLSCWKLLATVLLTGKDPAFKKSLSKNHGFPPAAKDEKQQMQTILSMLADIPELAGSLHRLRSLPDSSAFDDGQWHMLEALFELLPQAVIALQSLFSSQGRADFSEIALRALAALADTYGNPSDLLLRMDYRIQHVLIDEFQDTSELQISLLRCLTSGWQQGDGRTLFMVGDPMQSIYRFRKAEVGLFLQAASNNAELPPVSKLQLERNFRSSPVIVDWVNRAFGSIFPKKQDAISGAIAYANATAALSHDGRVCLHLLQASADSSQDDAAEAAAVAAIVKPAISRGQRVGILSRTRKHLHAIMPALTESGIPFRAINILPLHSRPEIRAMRALLRALLHPADRESWLALLRASYCGFTTADIFTLLHGDDRNIWEIINDGDVVARLEAGTQARIQHVQRALEPCMACSGKIKVRELLEAGWLRLGASSLLDETSRTNVHTLLELIDTLDENGRVDFSMLDERIEKLYAAPDSGTQAGQVELLTMHGAKGLQWDVVILPGLGKPPKGNDQPLLAFTDVPLRGKALLLMSPKAETRNKDALFSLVQSIEKQKENHELARLLYVACTRPETELHMIGGISKKGEAKKGSLLRLLLQHGDDCFGAKVEMIDTDALASNNQRKALQRIKDIPALPAEVSIEYSREPEYGWAGPEAAPIGTALHAILQQVADAGVETWTQKDSRQAAHTMERILIAEGLSGKLLDSAHRRCMAGLKQTLASKRGQWILSGNHKDAHCEWSLSFIQNGHACRRIIDRSFIDEEGTRWIIDYKTGSHEGRSLDAFLANEELRYIGQLEGYRELIQKMDGDRPIRLALYFPAFDAWKEIKPAL